MQFKVKAFREPEGIVDLVVEAGSLGEAQARAGEHGLKILSITRHWTSRFALPERRAFDLLRFTQELHALLDAGLSLIEALNALAQKESSAERRSVIDQLIKRLREGRAFSALLEERPELFPPLYVALVGASERTGDLKSALLRYIGYRQQMDALKKKVVSASIYPSLLIAVGGLVIVFLMGYVVPRFSRIYSDLGHDLPWMSRMLLEWGTLVQQNGLKLVAGIFLIGGLVGVVYRRRLTWRHLLGRLLQLGALRQRAQTYELARFYRTLGMLQQGGIPIVPALGMARGLLGDPLQASMEEALADIKAGGALSETLKRHALAPPVAYDLLRVGEKSGNVGEKMIRIADFFDEDLSQWIDWFSRLFEPLLMLLIGIFIAFIIMLLYLPIFELAGNIQ